MIISEPIAATFAERVFPGGLTYSGHPLACAAAVASINAMRDEGIVDNAAEHRRDRARARAAGAGRAAPEQSGRRAGSGVFWALDLVKDPQTREPLAPYAPARPPAMTELVAACKERGLLPFTNYNRLHVVPPCTITEAEAKEGLAILDEALVVADAHVTSS